MTKWPACATSATWISTRAPPYQASSAMPHGLTRTEKHYFSYRGLALGQQTFNYQGIY